MHPNIGALIALVGGSIYPYPGSEPIRNGVIVVEDGKIAALGKKQSVPKGAQIIDCSGLSITAGLWNSHVHFTEKKWMNAGEIPAAELTRQLQDFVTRYGFTSVFDLSSVWTNTRLIRERVESGEVLGPRIRSTGLGLLPANSGPPPLTALSFMGWMNYESPQVSDAKQATEAVKTLVQSGVDGIKLFASSPNRAKMPADAIAGAVSEAHRTGKPVFVHPDQGMDVLAAVRGGADIIAHTTPSSGPWDENLISEMKQHSIALIPTLWIWKYYARHERVSAQDKTVTAAVGQLRAWIEKGGTMLFGTDLGATDPDPTEEYLLMAQAGMTFPQILAALTTAPAQKFGEAGRIGVGLPADLAVLKGDPTKDLKALAATVYTIRRGQIIYRAPGAK
jgi:imidazolonepropionase-like amidohydrolase